MKRIIPCVVITLLLILAGFFVPGIGFIGLMLCPLPLAVLGCLEDPRKMSLAELSIEATLFIAVSPTMAVYFLIGCAPIAGVIFLLSRHEFKEVKKFSGPESLLVCVAAAIGFKLLLVVVYWLFTEQNIMFPNVEQLAVSLYDLYDNQPELQGTIKQILAIYPYLLPTMLVTYGIIEGFLNYTLCTRVLKKYFPTSKNFPPALPEFKLWRFPLSLLYASLFALITSFFVNIDNWFWGSIFLVNLQIVVSLLMFIQGLSLAFWIMDGFKLRRGAKIVVCIVLTFPFFWPWLIVIGMSELALNLRERIKFKS